MDNIDLLNRQLEELRLEHRDLDEVIQRLILQGNIDLLQIQRLKKRKLILKDQMTKLESRILPDIIA
ncbi:YdcH family protein [Lacibacterium aquatile]|uniref:YdcH family protein n=1 Tax=Lacibacterium aquatile TaxID=1168082 RepID=A0ABW5DNS0_9PROT